LSESPSNQRPTSPAPEAGLGTRLVTTSRHFDTPIKIANVPVYRASTVLFDSLDDADRIGAAGVSGELHASSYGTSGTPTTYALMDALAAIEGRGHDCRAAIMPSGLMAITAAILAFVKPGDEILMPDSVYGPARTFSQGMLARLGVKTVFYDPTSTAEHLATLFSPSTRILYLESPGSYTFEIQDVPALTALARSRGVISIIDNAWASPVMARPFDWGVDVSVLPLTKYWSGHSDVLMGAAVVRQEHWPALWTVIRQLGICVGGDDAFLILRGVRTAEVRMRQHEQNALTVARWLQSREEVARVLHPALPEHPQHALWRRDFLGSSGLFSFELAPIGGQPAQRKHVQALCEKRNHFGIGYSWGGFESLIAAAKLSTLRTIKPWSGGPLIRVHIGLEDPADLIADLDAGFARLRRS
jgi:cysteine-S-conjugate beta-lyase